MKRGWCPNLYEPMASGDGLLVRVKPPGGIVPAQAAMLLAEASERFGNGIVSLTNRANLQFRGLSAASVHGFAEIVVRLGLASTDALVERRRNVIVSPLNPTAEALGAELALMLAEPEFADLPGKFGVAVDGGQYSVGAAPCDVLVDASADRVCVCIGGLAAATAAPVEVTRRLIIAMLNLGASRMREAPAASVFAAAGLTPAVHHTPTAPAPMIGTLLGAFGVGLAFGQTDAMGLRVLARLAEDGDGTMRLSPWRAVLLPGVRAATLDRDDLITDPASPLIGMDACPGRPSCPQASVDTRSDALAWAGLAGGLHVSGCAKGCAHPGPAALTLVGASGRYDVVRNGSTRDAPVRSGLTVAEITAYLRAEGLR
jgi:precorrin-3B synthase